MTDALALLDKYGWHEWLCHTNFSFLVGASHPRQYLERALALGYRGVATTDFDGAYGLARMHLELRRLAGKTPPLKLMHGAELHFAADHELPVVYQDTLALVARSRLGYQNLCRLLTFAHRGGKSGAHVPLANILAHPVDDLIAIQPARGMMRRGEAAAKAFAERTAMLVDHFGGRLHFAFSRHLNPAEDCWQAPHRALATRLGVPCLLAQDAFFHAPAEKEVSDLLTAIRTNLTLAEASSQMFVNGERSLAARADLARRYGSLPFYEAALKTGRELADGCAFSLDELKYNYPKEMIPAGLTAQEFLEQLIWRKAPERYPEGVPDKVKELLRRELALIATLTFPDYFLTVWEIVAWAREQGILCQGRGSAANSAVCFVLGITSVNPATFELVFERFISVERGEPPDIDVDFEHERREEVIQYIYQRYGRAKAAMVANVITFRRRGALRSTGKALGVPEGMLGAASELLEARFFRGSSAEEVLKTVRQDLAPELRTAPFELWASMAERLRGFPRHLGIHSGGFILSDQPLDSLVPQEPATMPGRSVVQWSKEDIEGLGFFKIDLLALGMLTALRKGFDLIEHHEGKRLTLATIPADDLPTYQMIQRADTVGTFQIESRAQMSMLPRLRPAVFYDLVIEVAIIRPGPIQGGMIHPFLRRRNGLEAVTFPDERLRPILARTLGIPIFQEQAMRIAMAVGGFSAGEADELRRHMGAWSIKGDIGPWLTRMADGMRQNGIAEEFVVSILNQMRGFADYGFPESHSVSFALLAYASSYMKRHHPAAFFAALLNAQPMGFYSPHALIQGAQRDGVRILPIDANASEVDCTLEGGALRLGLRYVNRLSEKGAQLVVRRRAAVGGRFFDLGHFLGSVALYRSDLTSLAAANALQGFGLGRKAALWLAEAAPLHAKLEDFEEDVAWAEESSMERIQQDFAATPTSLGPHPTTVIRDEHWCYPLPPSRLVSAKDLPGAPANQIIEVFGMVLVRQAPPSANGMVFLTLEDATGFLNLVFTPPVYAKLYRLIEKQAFLCVKGRLQKNNESHSLMVMHIHEPMTRQGDVIPLTTPVAPGAALTSHELQPTRNYS